MKTKHAPVPVIILLVLALLTGGYFGIQELFCHNDGLDDESGTELPIVQVFVGRNFCHREIVYRPNHYWEFFYAQLPGCFQPVRAKWQLYIARRISSPRHGVPDSCLLY